MNETVEGIADKHRDYTGSKMGMWLFLVTEVYIFVGPFLLYALYRYRYPVDFHNASMELDLTIGVLNTLILLTSSLTMALSLSALRKGNKNLSISLVALTIFLGVVFLIDKYVEWVTKIGHGIYPNSEVLLKHSSGEIIFYGLYFFATGMHGLHVLAGIVLLLVMLILVFRGEVHQSDFIKLENSALYWHLVDIIWIYLFPLFYLIA